MGEVSITRGVARHAPVFKQHYYNSRFANQEFYLTIMIAIARHINNITINPYEYILNDDGDAITFNTKEECIQFLDEHTDTLQSEEEWEDEGIYFVEFND